MLSISPTHLILLYLITRITWGSELPKLTMLFSEIVTRLLKYTNTFLNPFLYRLKFWAENKKK